MGELDFGPILQTLSDLDYTRWLSVEVFDFTPGAKRTARQSLAYLNAQSMRGEPYMNLQISLSVLSPIH